MVRRRLLGRGSLTEAAERRCLQGDMERAALLSPMRMSSPHGRRDRSGSGRPGRPLHWPFSRCGVGAAGTPLPQSQRPLAMVRGRKASPPAEVGASPDRVGVGRGELAEQLDVVDLVVEACRGSS